ncbi:MAG TPA: thioredoxin domain-containing protein [Longimicrobiales bacterium]
MANRLIHETSPYLLQHADNPVDWYPWGEEAFARARAEERPILLSVGYSSCHWCHVMEHESFEDEDTARIMNERFISVKVDREERPDVDSIYMTAVQAMTGHGGWPMTVFIAPDGSPFYGGTYFPPEPRHGLPSFRQILLAVHDAWRSRRDDVLQSAAGLREALEQSTLVRAPAATPDASLLDDAFRRLARGYDARHGGFGRAPKFPQAMTLELLLRYHLRTDNEQALSMLLHTLRAMARGGMYDQIGGGFHRYSVDEQWLVPHFEKMLYDNALLAQIYIRTWQTAREPELRRVAEEILDYVRREMTAPDGGFYSAQDADSEGVEGKFYVWTDDEIDTVLGEADGPIFRSWYGVTADGNFEGHSILHVNRTADDAAAEHGISPERLRDVLAAGRAKLYGVRAQRTWPARDDKVLTSWNAMMLQAFAVAAQVLGRDEDRNTAVRAAEFLLRELDVEGRLKRTWKNGRARIDGFLEDYALLADALLSLYEATFDPRWVREARSLADRMLLLFLDEDEQLFYDAENDATLIVRPRSVEDNATPSGTSAATLMLLRLSVFTGEPRYTRIAARILENMAGLLHRAPLAFSHLLAALDFHTADPQEIAIVGDPDAPDTNALLDTARERYRPNAIVALLDPDRPGDAADAVPLLADRPRIDDRATAYVCRHFTCRQPVTDPAALRAQLQV